MIVTAENTTSSAVRYNWTIITGGYLFNREGLPAAPFRSDNTNEAPGAGSKTKP